MKRITVNVDVCSGCRTCELVCAFAHEDQFRPSVSRVSVMRKDICGFDFPVFCSHCDTCAALENCPSNALHRNKEGLIVLKEKACTHCGNCVRTCSFDAIRLHPDKNTPLLCDFCSGRPQCVRKCPTKALSYEEAASSKSTPKEVMESTLKRWRIVV